MPLPSGAILVADPSLARSPWAQFAEDEVGQPGLMKKRGGLVQYKEKLRG